MAAYEKSREIGLQEELDDDDDDDDEISLEVQSDKDSLWEIKEHDEDGIDGDSIVPEI